MMMCEDCLYCEKKNGILVCTEKWDTPCEKVDGCPEEIEEKEVQETRAIKTKHNEKADKPRKKSTKERKVDTEKLEILELLADTLKQNGYAPTIENEVKIHFDNYTIQLTRHRTPKK